MERTSELFAIIPARGGSKRIPGKNVAKLNGKPLLLYTVEAASMLGLNIIVSTDSAEIASLSKANGARVIERPAELATDSATTESVILHVLNVLSGEGTFPEWIMTLPATSPLRGPDVIRRSIALAEEVKNDVDCIFTVTAHRGDFWVKTIEDFSRLYPDAPRRQQDRTPLWEENSALYLTRVKALLETGFICGKKARGLPISAEEGWDINTPLDLKIAEVLLAATKLY